MKDPGNIQAPSSNIQRNSKHQVPTDADSGGFGIWRFVFGILMLGMCAVQGQQLAPHIGYVYPAGGKQGATFQVVVGGQYLGGVTNVFVSGGGISAAFVEYNRPLTQKEFNDLRDELRELQQKHNESRRKSSTNAWTAADERKVSEIRNRILKNPPTRQGNPVIAETVIVTVGIVADAEPGEREIRVDGPNGLSNPMRFRVGQVPEFVRPAAKAINPEIERFRKQFAFLTNTTPAKSEMRITLPAVANGQIMP